MAIGPCGETFAFAIHQALHQSLWNFKNLEVDMWWHAPNIAWPLRKDDM